MPRKLSAKKPLDHLILKVCHIELLECKDFQEYKEATLAVANNLEETLSALAVYHPPDGRTRRATERVKLVAVHLLDLCRAIPDHFDNPEQWREHAIQLAANYEQFRIEAGHLYHLATPGSTFDVLRSAL